MNSIKIRGNLPVEEPDDEVSSIGYWYDKYTRSWVIQKFNSGGDQLGDATYVGNREYLQDEISELQDKYSVPVRKLDTTSREGLCEDYDISGMTPSTLGDKDYKGFKLEYNPSLPGEARNLTTKIQIGPKFFNLSDRQKLYVLNHEVAHSTTDRLLTAENFRELSSIFLTKKIGARGSKIEGQEYWEGLFGDLGSSALSETITDAIVMYLEEPNELRRRSEEAYEFLSKKLRPLLKESQNFLRESGSQRVPLSPLALRIKEALTLL